MKNSNEAQIPKNQSLYQTDNCNRTTRRRQVSSNEANVNNIGEDKTAKMESF